MRKWGERRRDKVCERGLDSAVGGKEDTGGEGNTKEGVGITGERGNEGRRWTGREKREGRGKTGPADRTILS